MKTEPAGAVEFHLYEVFRTGKSAELESRLVLAGGPGGWGVAAGGSTVPFGVIMVHRALNVHVHHCSKMSGDDHMAVNGLKAVALEMGDSGGR